jgi:hypothetical protein
LLARCQCGRWGMKVLSDIREVSNLLLHTFNLFSDLHINLLALICDVIHKGK